MSEVNQLSKHDLLLTGSLMESTWNYYFAMLSGYCNYYRMLRYSNYCVSMCCTGDILPKSEWCLSEWDLYWASCSRQEAL